MVPHLVFLWKQKHWIINIINIINKTDKRRLGSCNNYILKCWVKDLYSLAIVKRKITWYCHLLVIK